MSKRPLACCSWARAVSVSCAASDHPRLVLQHQIDRLRQRDLRARRLAAPNGRAAMASVAMTPVTGGSGVTGAVWTGAGASSCGGRGLPRRRLGAGRGRRRACARACRWVGRVAPRRRGARGRRLGAATTCDRGGSQRHAPRRGLPAAAMGVGVIGRSPAAVGSDTSVGALTVELVTSVPLSKRSCARRLATACCAAMVERSVSVACCSVLIVSDQRCLAGAEARQLRGDRLVVVLRRRLRLLQASDRLDERRAVRATLRRTWRRRSPVSMARVRRSASRAASRPLRRVLPSGFSVSVKLGPTQRSSASVSASA